MKKAMIAVILAGAFLISGALATTYGILYTDVKEPVSASSLASYSKTASGGNLSILGLIGFGDSGVEGIAKKEGITKIKYVDKHVFSVLSLFVSETFTVYGE